MKRALATVFGSAALLIVVSQTARADAFLSLTNGATVSCNTSVAFSAVNCGLGFTAVLGGNDIKFTGTIGGYFISEVALTNNSPGNPAFAFATDSKSAVINVGAATPLTVLFAVNNFVLPAGSPLTLSAGQVATFASAAAGSSQGFTAWGNAANTLATVIGTAVATPACVNPAAAPPVNVCASAGVPVAFATAGPYALNGREIINLSVGNAATFQGTIATTPPTVVPEPSTVVLLATGLLALAGGRRVLRRKA